MKVTLQATGRYPVVIEYSRAHTSEQRLEKRAVRVTAYAYTDTPQEHCYCVEYLTEWPQERNFCWVVNDERQVRVLAQDMLPPGAGYPATEQFLARQQKLRGSLETITLTALSDVLKQIYEEKSK